MWTGLENLSFLCPRLLSRPALQHHSSFCSCCLHKRFGGSSHFPHKKAVCGMQPPRWLLRGILVPTKGLPSCCCAFAVPFSLPGLNLSSPGLLRHSFHKLLLHFFQPLGVPWCTYKPPFYPVSLRISASKQGLHHGTRRAGAPTLAGEEIEASTQ